MKILAIRGKNLASLAGEFSVEFDQEPLTGTGLFAITGSTGAGKSTLLDALCLALFDRIPRLTDSQGAIIGRPNEPENLREYSNDVRAILRRGSGDGYAEVEFLGNDGRRYRTRWAVRRARGSPTGKLQNQELVLTDLAANQPLGRTKTETLEQIQARLNLTFEQFRRSVLLAQGDFAAFLKANAKERSELLERITGTAIYTELSKAAHVRAHQEKDALTRLEQEIGALKPLDDAERAECERQLASSRQQQQQAEAALNVAQQMLAWWQKLDELSRLEQGAATALSQAEHALHTAEPRRQELRAVEQAQPLRGLLDASNRAERQHQDATNTLTAAETAVRQASAQAVQARDRHAQRQQAAQQTATALDVARPELASARLLDQRLQDASVQHAQAQRAQAEAKRVAHQAVTDLQQRQNRCAQLDQQQSAVAEWLQQNTLLSELARQWERWDQELHRYAVTVAEQRQHQMKQTALRQTAIQQQQQQRRLDAQFTTAQNALNTAQEQVRQLTAAAQEQSLDALQQERAHLEQRRDRLNDQTQRLRTITDQSAELERSSRERQDHLVRAEQANRKIIELSKERDQVKAALDEAERALTLARLARKEDAQTLRAQLQAGEPCPVCGAREHPWAHETPALVQLFDAQEQRVAELDQRLSTLIAAHGRLDAERTNAQQRAQELAQWQQTLTETLSTLRRQWQELPPDHEPLPDDPQAPGLAETLVQRLTAVTDELTRVRTAESQALAQQKRIEIARAELERQRTQYQRYRDQASALQTAAAKTSADQDHTQAVLTQAEQLLAELRTLLATPLAALPDWLAQLTADPHGFRAHCAQAAEGWRAQQERQETLTRQHAEAVNIRQLAEQKADTAQQTLTDKTAALTQQQRALDELRQQRNALFAGRAVADVERELTTAQQQAVTALEAARQALQQAEQHQAIAQTKRTAAHEELTRRQQDRDHTQAALERALTAAGLDLTTLRQRLQYDHGWIESERAALQQLDIQHGNARNLLETRRADTIRHRGDQPPNLTADQAREQSEQARQAVASTQETQAVLGVRLRTDADQRAAYTRRQGELDLQRQRTDIWDKLRELIGSYDGSKFRNFAQSLTLKLLLAHANHHLAELTPRYRLEPASGSELDLQVVDREMGDEVRGVHSLSGGESFLVSLALALGLASLSSHRTRVESLFIDEGFGSLDPDTLDTAIACLDALQSLGRKVGVISHVPAMVERIGVQVRVESRGGGRSTVRIVTGRDL
ncbi:MAG: AAA family ATPase [Candidatus Competibacteraceae bacterium]